MKALVVCPTYGRIPFLNRMVASFLSQTYDNKHLVIVNDDKNVEICCDNKLVTCINLNQKVLLPKKRNIGTVYDYCDVVMQYDDDDIFLPERIANHVQKHTDNPNIGYYRNMASYIVYGDKFEIAGCSPNASSYLQKTWYEVGGYANNENIADDMEFYYKIPNKLEDNDNDIADYVYNYGGVNYHATYEKDERVDEIAYQQLQGLDLVGKKFWIEPDYEEFNKFVKLAEMYKITKEPQTIIHTAMGKIDIPN